MGRDNSGYRARKVVAKGGQILIGYRVDKLQVTGQRIASVEARCLATGKRHVFEADYFLSTMPIRELVYSLDCEVPQNVRDVADGLVYRDFITVGLLLKKMKVKDESNSKLLPDTWIYVPEPDVLVGRVQIFNNWSPFMVADPDTVWIGLEYFGCDTDPVWKLSDSEMIALASEELDKIGVINEEDVLDGTVIRVPKTYPAYFGTYDRFNELRDYLDRFENLFLVGRNGMHKYNNQDHSMLTAMEAVDNIANGITDKSNLWAVDTEAEYHESKKEN